MHTYHHDSLPSGTSGELADRLDVAVVIVNYNHGKLLEQCLESIAQSDHRPAEIIVIDNASRLTPSGLHGNHSARVEIVINSRNVGFARAANQGISRTKTRYVLLLNPDTVLAPDAIGRMVDFMDSHPDVGVAGCRLVYPDGTLQWSCRTFYTPITILFRRGPLGRLWPNNPVSRKHLMADWDHKAARGVDWVLGACMVVRREAIEGVGMFDEGFFLYLEDVDWCYRMQQQGWKVYYFPEAEVVHHHLRASSGFNTLAWCHLRSMLYYYRKHFLSNLLPKRWREARHRIRGRRRSGYGRGWRHR